MASLAAGKAFDSTGLRHETPTSCRVFPPTISPHGLLAIKGFAGHLQIQLAKGCMQKLRQKDAKAVGSRIQKTEQTSKIIQIEVLSLQNDGLQNSVLIRFTKLSNPRFTHVWMAFPLRRKAWPSKTLGINGHESTSTSVGRWWSLISASHLTPWPVGKPQPK